MRPSHVAPGGEIAMVDVSHKKVTTRTARAQALVRMSPAAAEALRRATLPKGDALVAAQIAAIMAAKRTATLIPLAHQIELSSVDVEFSWRDDVTLRVETSARTAARTGVELEAMISAALAALTIYDMTKSIDRSTTIADVRLLSKTK
ncbi:MAG: cyclic pyranopterin monophosphate synthase MoaC [Candidatus Eremiobacteraeota bacterium]|nr:cyclic pyranopterin monophosphate synthase MoaC [Candidatus Eremiobacteraeota bacterium]